MRLAHFFSSFFKYFFKLLSFFTYVNHKRSTFNISYFTSIMLEEVIKKNNQFKLLGSTRTISLSALLLLPTSTFPYKKTQSTLLSILIEIQCFAVWGIITLYSRSWLTKQSFENIQLGWWIVLCDWFWRGKEFKRDRNVRLREGGRGEKKKKRDQKRERERKKQGGKDTWSTTQLMNARYGRVRVFWGWAKQNTMPYNHVLIELHK